MLGDIIKKVFGTKDERDVKKVQPLVDEINEHYQTLANLTDDELIAKTEEFKKRLAEGETVEDILPEAFAVVKDACRRHVGKSWSVCDIDIEWNMIPFDVQLIGGMVLHQGKIAEMTTGEGKTLVATMPLYLNALTGRGVHLVTVNDYLAERDSEWMGEIFKFHGLTVGVILNTMDPTERQAQYQCDITYGTNNEFGFDYLRDNMAIDPEHQVQREYNYAIVDEVDSVLIDEARTPLIISGPVEEDNQRFDEMKPKVERLFRLQTNLVAQIVQEADNLLNNESTKDATREAGINLLRAYRGLPKNKKLLKTLNLWDKIKLFTSGFSIRKDVGKDFSIDTILEEVEKKEESKKINKIMDSLMNKNKKLKKILIDERNEFIAYNIQQAVKDPEVTSIVLVIGAGHVPGVIENLDNQHINMKKILSLK